MLRGAVVHEDNLINHRLTWLLVAHGFLITGLVLVQTAALKGGQDRPAPVVVVILEVLLVLLFACAIVLCRVVGSAVTCALEHQVHLRLWWMKKYATEERADIDFPRPPRTGIRALMFAWLRGEPFFRYMLTNPAVPIHAPAESRELQPQDTHLTTQPPLLGSFKIGLWAGVSAIPMVFLLIDMVIALTCFAIGTLKAIGVL
jgi:hypothetical protein